MLGAGNQHMHEVILYYHTTDTALRIMIENKEGTAEIRPTSLSHLIIETCSTVGSSTPVNFFKHLLFGRTISINTISFCTTST